MLLEINRKLSQIAQIDGDDSYHIFAPVRKRSRPTLLTALKTEKAKSIQLNLFNELWN